MTNEQKTMIGKSVSAFKSVKGGSVMLFGHVVEESEKAIKFNFGFHPVSMYGCNQAITIERTAWVPKSVVVERLIGTYVAYEIKDWFVSKSMKSFPVKQYDY
jgi:hypothetical protein